MHDHFKETAGRLLRQLGLAFTGIHLHCRHCGEEAFAATPEMAAVFGWFQIKPVKAARYQGRCMTCTRASLSRKGVSS